MIHFPAIDLTGKKALLIDIDDTLYAFEPCHQKALEACHTEITREGFLDLSLTDFKKFYTATRQSVAKRLHPQGVCRSRLLAFLTFFESHSVKDGYQRALAYDSIYWNALMAHMQLEPQAERLLKTACSRGMTVVAVTDMLAAVQIQKLVKLGVSGYIHFITTSEEAGAEKPSPLIFNQELQKAKAMPEDAVMVGDSFEKDIKGAQNLGIAAYQVKVS